MDCELSARDVGEPARHADDGIALCPSDMLARAALDATMDVLAGLGRRLRHNSLLRGLGNSMRGKNPRAVQAD